jgi:hypothetical protein
MVVIPGMPPTHYPLYVRSLVQYTLATLMAENMEVSEAITSPAIVHAVTVSTAVRAGVWSALDRVPSASAVASPAALRWSARKERIQVVAASSGDGTALWRHCLARSTGLLAGTSSMAQVLVGLAPMLFVLGGAHVLSSGELYSYHFVENEVRTTIVKRMSATAVSSLSLRSSATWDIMVSSGLTGFACGLVKLVCEDPAFITASQIRVCRSNSEVSRLRSRLAKIVSGARSPALTDAVGTDGIDSDEDPFVLAVRTTQPVDEDAASVADTLDSLEDETEIDDRPVGMRSPGAGGPPIPPRGSDRSITPRPGPDITPEHRAEIVSAMRGAALFGPRAASEVMGADPDETVKWG